MLMTVCVCVCVSQSADGGDVGSPLLDPGVQHIGGEIIMPGNTALTSLNLSGQLSVCLQISLGYSVNI